MTNCDALRKETSFKLVCFHKNSRFFFFCCHHVLEVCEVLSIFGSESDLVESVAVLIVSGCKMGAFVLAERSIKNGEMSIEKYKPDFAVSSL